VYLITTAAVNYVVSDR